MKKILLFILAMPLISSLSYAQKIGTEDKVNELDEVVVTASSKETQNLWKLPSATSIITPFKINVRGIESLKDITTMVPNLFIPDYGSKMTTPIYLRGVGTRSSSQSVGVYVDNIPYMDKSAFDFEMMDVQVIEVLRGPQGTLYGRNAMGGIINIRTLSPLKYKGTRISLGGGSHGSYKIKASHHNKLAPNVGIAVMGYYDHTDGYFVNQFDGKRADYEQSGGGRIKLDWRLNNHLNMKFETAFDYTDQGAFPYGLYDKVTKEIAPVNYNDEGSYRRSMVNSNLRFEYRKGDILFSSNTGYQYLDDDMMMDQDYTAASIFTLNQRQKQHSINQEFALRSTNSGTYQWSVGLFGFYNNMNTTGDVTFKKDGVQNILQKAFDTSMPPFIRIKITDEEIVNKGTYKTPTMGVALFHQSTVNITDKFSIVGGVRFDYEKQKLDYDASMVMHTMLTMSAPAPNMTMPFNPSKAYVGELTQDYIQFLPKLSLKYEFDQQAMVYATVAKGYKAGGYNNQMFAEVVKNSIKNVRPEGIPGMPNIPPAPEVDLNEVISYKPEMTWSYEVGSRATLFNLLRTELSVFCMDIQDLQLTKFIDGGSGRILTNAGRGRSYGVELSLGATLGNLSLDGNYGFNHSKFTDYDGGKDENGEEHDYTGNFVPYTPQHTFSLGASYKILTFGKFLEQVTISADYNGCGKIYWTEKNDIEQPFYGLLNSKVSLHTKIARVDLWARNILSTEYNSFYFENLGNSFFQKGRPITYGATLIVTL